jgi:Asp-tRNA(Asn)/Glu-tRNA(Gln) amidotransferase C subunit
MQEYSIKLELKDEELVALKGELSEITKRFEKHMQVNEEAERVFNH